MVNKYYTYISKIEAINDEIRKNLKFIHGYDHIRNNSTVFIKPNFTFPSFKEGITTNPVLIRNLLEQFNANAARVIVGESPFAFQRPEDNYEIKP